MPKSLLNNRIYPLASGETFLGLAEATAIETGQWTAISVSVAVPTVCTLTIEQTYNKTNWFVTETTTLEPDVLKIVQQAITLPYFRVKLENLGTLQTYCHLVSSLVANLTQDLNIRSLETGRDNVLISGEDSIGGKHTLLTDASGALVVVASLSPADNQDVTVTARSGTGFLSYLTDNVAIATMPSITGTVAVSSQPHLSYLTDNIAVATQPALTFATDKVDATGSAVSVSNFPATQPISGSVSVSNLPATQPISGSVSVSNLPATQPVSGTVAVSSQPPLSYLTDNVAVATLPPITGTVAVSSAPYLSYLTSNIAVATQPALVFATDKVDTTGSAVTISSGAITETNSGTISSTLTSLNGKVTECNTGAVVITTLPSIPTGGNVIGGVTTDKTTSSITSWENPTQIISFDSGNTVRQIKGTAGSLHSLSITNDNNALAFVAIYDLPAAGVTPGATTPKAVFVIQKNQQIQLPLHAVQFSNGISYFTATTYNGGTPLTLVYLTASYNG